jgi:hypothetical protein
MNISDIVLEIDAEIAQLQKVKELLTGDDVGAKRREGRPGSKVPSKSVKTTSSTSRKSVGKGRGTRTMSAEGRSRIAAAQKARWAKSRRGAKTTVRNAASARAKKAVAAKTTKVIKAVPMKKSGQSKVENATTATS